MPQQVMLSKTNPPHFFLSSLLLHPLTEAAIFADKVAVDEETVRLRSHLQQMNTMLTGGGAVGRKLDFLLQEMNREANTIGSKCTDVKLARIVEHNVYHDLFYLPHK